MSFTFENLKVFQIPVTPLRQNCALMFDKNTLEGVVVDPGGNGNKILEFIKKHNVKVKEIWITHCHFDHIGAADFVSKALNVPVIGSSIEDKLLLQYNVTDIAAGYGITDETMANVSIDRFLQDGEVLTCSDYSFKVLHIPGHAPGHVVFYSDELKFAIMGDVLFRGSIGRTDLIGSNHAHLMEALAKKIIPLEDEVEFICGHGPGSTLGREKLHNPFLQALL